MTTHNIEQISAGLSEAQKDAVATFDATWKAGPSLTDFQLEHIEALEAECALERHFMDEGPPAYTEEGGGLNVRLVACWHFRLTPLGLSVREYLKEQSDEE